MPFKAHLEGKGWVQAKANKLVLFTLNLLEPRTQTNRGATVWWDYTTLDLPQKTMNLSPI